MINLPAPSKGLPESTLTIDECIDLMQKEIAEFEQQLKNRQLEIVMRLRQEGGILVRDETLADIANAIALIAKIRLYGTGSIINNTGQLDWHDVSTYLPAKRDTE